MKSDVSELSLQHDRQRIYVRDLLGKNMMDARCEFHRQSAKFQGCRKSVDGKASESWVASATRQFMTRFSARLREDSSPVNVRWE